MPHHESRAERRLLLPVVFGGDVGAYTLGLEAYEAWGVRSICVAHQPVDLINRSKIFDVIHIEPQASDASRIGVIRNIAAQNPGRKIVLLANNDALIGFFTRNREQLGPDFVIPFPSYETVSLLSSKEGFAKVCERAGVSTPPSVSVDLATPADTDWVAPNVPFRFPVIAKADASDQYEKVDFVGKEKVYFIDTVEELDSLWTTLRDAGYFGTFLVQELIPGPDTQKRTVTMYVDANGEVTLRAAAQVLLEDPTPTMIGNPSAMISRSMPELWEQATRLLNELGYRGFANFDLKVDPRDGTPYFFELNPRAGRSSYFVVAGGQNPLEVMAKDLVDHERPNAVDADRHALYTLLPVSLILHYVKDRALRSEIWNLVKQRRVVNPLHARVENDPKRRLIVRMQSLNHFRKFHRYFRADL